MTPITKEQRRALKRIYDRGGTPLSYRAFRRTVVGPLYKSDPCIMVPWAGMWLGIEPDGYTHS